MAITYPSIYPAETGVEMNSYNTPTGRGLTITGGPQMNTEINGNNDLFQQILEMRKRQAYQNAMWERFKWQEEHKKGPTMTPGHPIQPHGFNAGPQPPNYADYLRISSLPNDVSHYGANLAYQRAAFNALGNGISGSSFQGDVSPSSASFTSPYGAASAAAIDYENNGAIHALGQGNVAHPSGGEVRANYMAQLRPQNQAQEASGSKDNTGGNEDLLRAILMELRRGR